MVQNFEQDKQAVLAGEEERKEDEKKEVEQLRKRYRETLDEEEREKLREKIEKLNPRRGIY